MDRRLLRLPPELLGDIILTFLLGKRLTDKIGNCTVDRTINHIDYNKEIEYIAKWVDIFELRNYVLHHLKKSDDNDLIYLANILAVIYKRANDLRIQIQVEPDITPDRIKEMFEARFGPRPGCDRCNNIAPGGQVVVKSGSMGMVCAACGRPAEEFFGS